jgi:serine protease
MTIALRRLSIGLLAATALAGGPAVAETPDRSTFGPLPATISSTQPVRVVSTTRDHTGRPVVTVHTATDKTEATKLLKAAETKKNAIGVEVDAKITATSVPSGSDPFRTKQWDFARLHAATAWQSTTGTGITVAVLDTGVDATQPDLAGQVLSGFDAIAGGGTADSDPSGHGTHVAGVIAADTGNNVGISAIAPNAKILPVRVLGANGEGYMSAAASGIVYAADNGAKVINMSFDSPVQVDAVSTAIAYARGKGVVVVAAAGNDRKAGSPISYPAATDGVIAVGATDQAEHVATFSTAGSYIDLTAPGTDILSTWPGGRFTTMSGTSMAAPHVAAIAALLLGKDPTLTPDLVERVMESSALDRGPSGRDDDYGYGRVDAGAALTLLHDIPNGTGTPAPPTKKAKTRPTIKVAQVRQSAFFGDTATTTFTVGALNKPWAQQPVQVCLAPAGSAYTCTTDTTSDSGTVTVRQIVSSTYAVKIVTTASDTADAITSPVVTVTAATRVTVASTAPGTLEVTLDGAAGQTVQVQLRKGTRWTVATSYPAEADHVLTGLASGSYRVVVPMAPALLGATSATVVL